ncbi:hypothetical protein PM082_024872 [Marasmius tenuissimus]|nr:hypothetical protein PM082_024872 [Marasmius tenuissimus]
MSVPHSELTRKLLEENGLDVPERGTSARASEAEDTLPIIRRTFRMLSIVHFPRAVWNQRHRNVFWPSNTSRVNTGVRISDKDSFRSIELASTVHLYNTGSRVIILDENIR